MTEGGLLGITQVELENVRYFRALRDVAPVIICPECNGRGIAGGADGPIGCSACKSEGYIEEEDMDERL